MKTIIQLFLILITINVSGQSPDFEAYTIGQKHTIYSKILHENREILIYIPKGFWGMDENLKNAPVTFVLDGESQFLNTVTAIDFLSSAPLGNDIMPRTIVVGIPNTNRDRDLTPTKGILPGGDSTTLEITGGGVQFLEFITTELSPYIDSLYSTSVHRTIIGHSLGGLIVFEALLNKRDFFNNYLAIDPALSYDNESYFRQILDTLRTANLSSERLFIAKANTFPTFLNIEDIETDTSEIVKITQTNQRFLKLSNTENWNINYTFLDLPNENHFSIPYLATYEGFKFFYNYFPFRAMINYYHPSFRDKTDLVDQLKNHYQSISIEFGNPVIPMESYLYSWAYGFAHFGRKDLSIDLFDYNIELYPNHSSVYNTKAFFMLNLDKKKEAIELFNKSLLIKEDGEIRKVLETLQE